MLNNKTWNVLKSLIKYYIDRLVGTISIRFKKLKNFLIQLLMI